MMKALPSVLVVWVEEGCILEILCKKQQDLDKPGCEDLERGPSKRRHTGLTDRKMVMLSTTVTEK